MKTIWKYELEITDEQYIDMPKNARVLSAGNQNGKLCLWAMVSTEAKLIPHRVAICGTGLPCYESSGNFIDSVQIGQFVWHVFA